MELVKNNNIKILLGIFILTMLVYGNSIKNDFSLDDNYVTVTNSKKPNNSRIEKGISGIPEIFTTHYINTKQQSFEYRPITLSSFAIEYELFGVNPHINHFINILLFMFTNILLYKILVSIFKKESNLYSLCITILFIIHPIHTEVVNNIKCRDELLSFMFSLLSLYLVIKNIETKKNAYLIIAFITLYVAILSKSSAIIFIGIIPITIYFYKTKNYKKIVCITLLLFCSYLLFNFTEYSLIKQNETTREFAFFENPLYYKHTFIDRLSLVFYSTGYYLKLMFLPYPLSCYYGYNIIQISKWSSPYVIISLFFHIAVFVYLIKNINKKNNLYFGLIIYLIGVYPFSNLTKEAPGIIADRLIYTASLGACIFYITILFKLSKISLTNTFNVKQNNMFIILSFTIFISYSLLTISRNSKWKNESILFSNDIKNFESSCNLQFMLGNYLFNTVFTTQQKQKRDSLINKTKFHMKKACDLMIDGIKKYPEDYITTNNIGTIFMNIFNDLALAQKYFKKSLSVNPNNEITIYNIGYCFEKMNLKDSAIYYYEKLVKKNTTYSPTYSQLRKLYSTSNQINNLINCDKTALKTDPDKAELEINLGNSYLLINDSLNAINHFIIGVKKEPNNFDLKNQIKQFILRSSFKKKIENL